MEHRETPLLSNTAFLAAICVHPRYQALSKYSQKTLAQTHLAALRRRLQMLQESVDTTDVECQDSSSESENESTPAWRVAIIDEILTTWDAFHVSLTQGFLTGGKFDLPWG